MECTKAENLAKMIKISVPKVLGQTKQNSLIIPARMKETAFPQMSRAQTTHVLGDVKEIVPNAPAVVQRCVIICQSL